MSQPPDMPDAERTWMIDTLLALLQTPSPTGRTDAVMQLIGEMFDDIGIPFSLTRRGALIAELPGESPEVDRAIVVHADTVGAMVSRLKDNRSEERRVGKECSFRCRSRWSPYH